MNEIHYIAEELKFQITFTSKYPQLYTRSAVPRGLHEGKLRVKMEHVAFL